MRLGSVVAMVLGLGACACGGGARKPTAAKPEPPPAKVVGEPAPEQVLSLTVTRTTTNPDADPPSHRLVVELSGGGAEPARAEVEWQGACATEDGGEAVLQVRCWWAGAGDVLTIIRDGDTLVLAHVALDETTPPGPPEILETLSLLPGARLTVRK